MKIKNPSSVKGFFAPLIFALVVIGIAWPAITNMRHAAIQAQIFELTDDEALHCEIATCLNETGKYQQWSGAPFAPNLTTGPTVIVPAVIMSKIFGFTPCQSGRTVVLLYHFALLGLIGFWLMQKWGGRSFFGFQNWKRTLILQLLSAGMLHMGWRGFDGSNYYLFGILGEGPSIFYLVLCFYFLSRKNWSLAGAAASLAILSKPYLLLLPLAVGLAILFSKEFRFRTIYKFGIGFLVPWMFWLTWMSVAMGVSGTIEWWRIYPQIMRGTNGGGLPLEGTAISGLISVHIKALPKLIKLRAFLMMILGIAAWVKYEKKTVVKSALAFFFIIHLSWWIILTPGIQSRYLLPVGATGWLAFCLTLFPKILIWLEERPRLNRLKISETSWAIGMLILIVIFVSFQVLGKWQKGWRDFTQCAFCRQTALQAFYKSRISPPSIYTTTRGYANDKAILLSAPHRHVALDSDLSKKPPNDGWIVVGVLPYQGILESLAQHKCEPMFIVGDQKEGFWSCP